MNSSPTPILCKLSNPFLRIVITGIVAMAAIGIQAQADVPKLFWGSDPINAGETAMLFGDGIGTNVTAMGWRVEDTSVTAPPTAPQTWAPPDGGKNLEVLQASDKCAKVVLPKEFAPGMYAVRLKGEGGVSAPWILNRAEAWWWLGGVDDKASAGEELRIFGKNFGEKTRAWIVAGNGSVTELPMVKAENYALLCRVPETLPEGDYKLWVHNGKGGVAGFGDPLTVPVMHHQPWPAKRFDVKAFGAKGDGTADDTGAIEAALSAARANGGGVVYLPRGTYKISGKLILPAKTVFKGEGRESVNIVLPWITTEEVDSVLAGDGDFGVEDLSITALAARRMIICPTKPAISDGMSYAASLRLLPDSEEGHNVRLRRLCLRHIRRALGVEEVPLRPHGWAIGLIGRDMEVSDCDIMSSDGAINVHGRHFLIVRNRIASASRHQDVEECVFAENSIRDTDMDNTGNCFEGKAYRLYIANNRIQDTYGWDREAITFDVPYGHDWMGQIKMASPTVMTLPSGSTDNWGKKWQPGELRGHGVMIVSGKGLGQFIPIIDNKDQNVTLERPWGVEPDATSWVVIRTIKNQVVLTGNQFEDAGKAIQLYANSYGFIIDGNTATRAGGMYGSCRDYMRGGTRRCYSSCAFNQWINNTINDGLVIARDGITFADLGPNADFSTLSNPVTVSAMANVVRNNTVSGDVNLGTGHDIGVIPKTSSIRGRDTVIEGNRISDTPGSSTNASGGAMKAMVVSGLFANTLLRSNQVAPCPLPLNDDGKNTWIHPAERLSYQIESVKAVLGDFAQLQGIRKECSALLIKPVDPSVMEACNALREKLLSAAASKTDDLTPDLLTSLTGLRYVINQPGSLATPTDGKPKRSTLPLSLRSEPWSPALTLQATLLPPTGWPAAIPSGAVELPPNTPRTVHCEIDVPPGGTVEELPLQLDVTLGKTKLVLRDTLTFNRFAIHSWLVSSSGSTGGWKPLSSEKNGDLAELVSASSSTIYLAAGIEASEPADTSLEINCKGVEATFYLNDKKIAALSQHPFGRSAKAHRDSSFRVHLDKGLNILLVKVNGSGTPGKGGVTFGATLVTDPGQKKAAPCLMPEKTLLTNPQLNLGKAGVAGAAPQPLDDFTGGKAEEWKFGPGACQECQVVESGDPVRGKVLKRELTRVWDVPNALMYREIKPGTFSDPKGGIRVWLKSSCPAWIDLGLHAGGREYVACVSCSTSWQECRVPFGEFIQHGPEGKVLPAGDLEKIDHLTVSPRNDNDDWDELTLFISGLGVLQPGTPHPKSSPGIEK